MNSQGSKNKKLFKIFSVKVNKEKVIKKLEKLLIYDIPDIHDYLNHDDDVQEMEHKQEVAHIFLV